MSGRGQRLGAEFVILLLILHGAAGDRAAAQPAGHSPEPIEGCDNAPDSGSVAWLGKCFGQVQPAEDRSLAHAVARLSVSLPTNARRQALYRVQQLWLEYRDAKCDFFMTGADGGQIQYFEAWSCTLEETKRRRVEVELLLPPESR